MPNLRSKDPNMMLYGRSPRKMAPDLLPQYADVDLSVEFYKQSGSGEWEAIKRTTGDLLSIYSRTLLTSLKWLTVAMPLLETSKRQERERERLERFGDMEDGLS